MPTFQTRQAVAAAGSVPNFLTGSPIEYTGDQPITLTIYGGGDILGMSHQLSLFTGSKTEVPIPLSNLSVLGVAGKVQTNTDFIAQVAIMRAVRLVHLVNNPGAASFASMLYVIA